MSRNESFPPQEPGNINAEEPAAADEPYLVLTTVDGASCVVKNGDIVGRTAVGHEFLGNFPQISRHQVKFVHKYQQWFVVDLNSRNGTFLDDLKLFQQVLTPVRNGERLHFSSVCTCFVSIQTSPPLIANAHEDEKSDDERKTLVVLFADIKGSVDFFQEMGTIIAHDWIYKLFRMLTAIIQQHQGVHIKNIGDAILTVFADPAGAVRAATKMQSAIADHNRCVDFSQAYSLRIGMNIGRVLYTDNDIFGNAVNIASRVQDMTPPGCIYITGELWLAVCQHADITTRFIGNQVLKGVRNTMAIHEVVLAREKE